MKGIGVVEILFGWMFLVRLQYQVKGDECYPCSCTCEKWYHPKPCINCKDLKLSSVPSYHFNFTTTIRSLILDNNFLTTLSNNIFINYTNLEVLSLSYNHISTIPKESFTEIPSLKWLYLDNNNIQKIENHSFRDLGKLEKLGLHYNKIRTISSDTFTGLHLSLIHI